jgi:hypothetical protein
MPLIKKCGTNGCQNDAEFDIFWPGREPLGVCTPCRDRALHIASAMGFYLHTIPADRTKQET